MTNHFSDFPSDDELLKAIREGDERAKHLLYEKYNPLVRGIIGKTLGETGVTAADREGATSEAWVKVIKYVGGVTDPDRLPVYLVRVAKGEAYRRLSRHIKNQQKQIPLQEVENLPEAEITRPDVMLEATQRVNVWLALAHSISPEFSKILYLRHVEELDLPDISEIMGMPYEQVRRIYYRGLPRLKKMLKEYEA